MKNYLILAAIVIAGVVPFSSRAVYMDEHIFLQIAQSAQDNWLFPQDTPKLFFGTLYPNLAAHTHPPVGEYYLAILYAAFGGFSEWPYRLAFSVFAITAVLSFYTLARRFTSEPLLLTLLFAWSPALFVYSSTLMMDVPMLAFLLLGFALFMKHVEGRHRLLPLAGLAFVLAVGTGYTALIPLGCFFVGLAAARRPWRELIAVAAAPLVLGLWTVMMTIHFGEFALGQTVAYFTGQNWVLRNIVATFSFLGIAVFPWTFGSSRTALIAGLGSASILSFLVSWPSFGQRVWYILLASAGAALLLAFFRNAKEMVAQGKNRGEAFLLLWVPATLAFFIVVADMINARYMLLTLPALYLIVFRQTDRRRLLYAIVPTAALSLGLAYADFVFVNSYRDWVRQTVVPLQQQGFNVWGAAESGLRFYLEQQGIESLSGKDTRPRPMDLVVRPANSPDGLFRYSLAKPVEVILTPIKTFVLNHSFPVRTFNVIAGGGFHDSRIGIVPFALSRVPLDRIEITQVSPLPGAVWSSTGPAFKQTEPLLVFPMKVPANSTIEYDLEGDGRVDMVSDQIHLKKGATPVIWWRNFRIVPKQFAVE